MSVCHIDFDVFRVCVFAGGLRVINPATASTSTQATTTVPLTTDPGYWSYYHNADQYCLTQWLTIAPAMFLT